MNIIDTIYKHFLMIISKIKIFKTPAFLVYEPYDHLINGNDWAEFNKKIKPGDIILRTYVHTLISKIIPGFYSHAGICIDKNNIIHAVGTGVEYISPFDFAKCDGLIVIRPNVDKISTEKAINYAKKQIGKGYDFWLNFNSEDTYSCTELVYWCYKDVIETKPILITKLFDLINHYVIEPDQFLTDTKCKIIWKSHSIK